MVGNVFSLGLNSYTEIVKEQMSMVDGDNLKTADCDRMFITVNANKRTPLIPANALVRYQFLEILMRLAFKMFFETGLVESESLAV
jgi:hypothetical protein